MLEILPGPLSLTYKARSVSVLTTAHSPAAGGWATSHPSEYRPGGYRTVLTPLHLARKEGPEALAEWMMVVRVRLC